MISPSKSTFKQPYYHFLRLWIKSDFVTDASRRADLYMYAIIDIDLMIVIGEIKGGSRENRKGKYLVQSIECFNCLGTIFHVF